MIGWLKDWDLLSWRRLRHAAPIDLIQCWDHSGWIGWGEAVQRARFRRYLAAGVIVSGAGAVLAFWVGLIGLLLLGIFWLRRRPLPPPWEGAAVEFEERALRVRSAGYSIRYVADALACARLMRRIGKYPWAPIDGACRHCWYASMRFMVQLVETRTWVGEVEAGDLSSTRAAANALIGMECTTTMCDAKVLRQLDEPWVNVCWYDLHGPGDVLLLRRAYGNTFDQRDIDLLRERLVAVGLTYEEDWNGAGCSSVSFRMSGRRGADPLTPEQVAFITAPRALETEVTP